MTWVILGVIALIVVLVLGWGIAAFNRLVRQRNQVQAAGAQVDVQLKRRHDLIPNLVNAVKGYMDFEKGVLTQVTEARAAAVAAGTSGNAAQAAAGAPLDQRAAAEGALTQALGRLFAVAEAYPELKANQNFLALQGELAATEDKIAYARQFLNSAVQTLNTSVESLPTNLVAGVGGFRRAEYFEAAGDERGGVQVRF
jgi:LemA protein